MPAPKEKQTYYSIVIGGKFHDVTGRKRTKAGYVTLCIKSHPYSDVQGYIFEHRIIMEMKIGRYLKPHEVVHHINEIKHDNRLENLELMDHGEHTAMHHTGLKRDKETKERISRWAKKRLSDKRNHPTYKNVDEELTELYRRGFNITQMSSELGIARQTVRNKINYLGLKETDKDD